MKTKSLFLSTMLLAFSAHATDWNQLFELAPSAQTEIIQLDERGNVTARVVKMPSGKMRFIDFGNFQVESKPTIQIESKETDLQVLCQFGVVLDKPFRAKLTMPVNAAASLSTGFLGKGSKLDNFDNPVKVEKPIISVAKNRARWAFYDKEVMKNSPGSIGDYYLSILNEQLEKSDGNTITLDLTKHNAMACDMLFGNIVFEVSQTYEFEKGMPAQKMWLGRDQFTAIYRKFWTNQPILTNNRQTTVQNQVAEGIALGVSIGLTLKDDSELKSASRVQKLLTSVKNNIRNLDLAQKVTARSEELHEAWISNVEYSIPESLISRNKRTVLDAPADVKFTR